MSAGIWGAPGFCLRPVAAQVGPFPLRPFLETWWRHRGSGEPWIVASPQALVAVRRSQEGVVEFMGEPDLTDYHSPLGPGAEALVAGLVGGLGAGARFRFDSLPEEAAAVVAAGAARAGLAVAPVPYEVTAVLDLPATFDDYLAGLDGKDRHELRRKHRRFEQTHGVARLEPWGRRGLAVFSAMHRASPGSKGGFLTPGMEAFFADLLELDGSRLDVVVGAAGVPLGAALGFQDDAAYYLYNSAYDPGAASSSPGVVLIELLARRAIADGLGRFDFLKGAEAYKFRLGARPRPLFVVEGVR